MNETIGLNSLLLIGAGSVALLGAVRNMENATDVRHAAAKALGKVAEPSDAAELKKLATDYPEVSDLTVKPNCLP